MKFSDRKPDILLALGNRADLDTGVPSRMDKWCRDAYTDLCASIRFDTLKVSKVAQIAEGNDTLTFPVDTRAIEYITIVMDDGTTQVMDEKDIKYVRQYTATGAEGVPSVYALMGTTVILRPVPDQAYQIIWDYWQKAQIAPAVSATVLNIPDDWLEIFDYMVMVRAHVSLLERDKAQEIKELLFGAKTQTGKLIPGLIAQKMTMNQAQAPKRDFGIAPKIQRYTS